MKDSRRRSMTKAFSYRVLATLATTIIVFLFTGRLLLSISIGLSDGFIKILCFYLHERLWQYVSWGRVIHPLANTPLRKDLTPQDLQVIHKHLEDLGYI